MSLSAYIPIAALFVLSVFILERMAVWCFSIPPTVSLTVAGGTILAILLGYLIKRYSRTLWASMPSVQDVGRMAGEVPQIAFGVWKRARRFVVFVIGMTVLVFGLALIVLPGPAFVVIPIGLAVLATEFVWARRLLKRLRSQIEGIGGRWTGKKSPDSQPSDRALGGNVQEPMP